MKAYLNDVNISDNCFVENHKMLDGKVNFKEKNETKNFSFYKFFEIDDERYEGLKKIHLGQYQECDKMLFKEKINNVLFGLKYFEIDYIAEGYRFGKELTYRDFCICFDSQTIITFASSRNGYISPDYLELQKEKDNKNFNIVYRAIKKSIEEYFDIIKEEK